MKLWENITLYTKTSFILTPTIRTFTVPTTREGKNPGNVYVLHIKSVGQSKVHVLQSGNIAISSKLEIKSSLNWSISWCQWNISIILRRSWEIFSCVPNSISVKTQLKPNSDKDGIVLLFQETDYSYWLSQNSHQFTIQRKQTSSD